MVPIFCRAPGLCRFDFPDSSDVFLFDAICKICFRLLCSVYFSRYKKGNRYQVFAIKSIKNDLNGFIAEMMYENCKSYLNKYPKLKTNWAKIEL